MSEHNTGTTQVGLCCHPVSDSRAVSDIQVTAQRLAGGQLRLSYRVSGDLAGLRIPQIVQPERRDELWRHTCAELFVAVPDEADYAEFNFSPTTCWAAYAFSGYRQDMRPATDSACEIAVQRQGQMLQMDVRVQLPAKFRGARKLQLGITMVIEDSADQYSYWAVRHVAAKPDFHCRENFVLTI